MQAVLTSAPSATIFTQKPAWLTMYSAAPGGDVPLYELEIHTARRMELLGFIDQLLNAPKTKNFEEIRDKVTSRLAGEFKQQQTSSAPVDLLVDAMEDYGPAAKSINSAMVPQEDLLSHILCRFAFCISDTWRKWMMRTEEVLLRCRLSRVHPAVIAESLQNCGVTCRSFQINEVETSVHDKILLYSSWRKRHKADVAPYFLVPLRLVTKLVKERKVLCTGGLAVVSAVDLTEVFVTVFRLNLAKGLQDVFQVRCKALSYDDEDCRLSVYSLVDSFLSRFVVDTSEAIKDVAAGSVQPSEVQLLANSHMPLCMRRVDHQLRSEGHLKHHGRFMYGLFLKQIGLSLEGAIQFLGSLMTQKGGGSEEAFSKSAYGYHVRHNYGKEGKRTNYTSMSCGSIINMPPTVDRHDCHGCPFRFKDEAALRGLLQKEQRSPCGSDFPNVRPSIDEIEEIVNDAKGTHYSRACYKYFTATHPSVRRDTLFRSPYEYFTVSIETSKASPSGQRRPIEALVGMKRAVVEVEPHLNIKSRIEST